MISVIIPIDQRIEYLEACLDSIKAQTYTNMEIICIFDGHKKGWNIAQKFVQIDTRFEVVEISKGGPGLARNAGLDKASGEYVAFCDSDDILPKKALASYMSRLEGIKSEIDVVLGSFIEQFDSGIAITCSLNAHGNSFDKFFSYISVWNRLYRRNFLENNKIRFPNKTQGEDILFLSDIFLKSPKIIVIKDIVYQWQRHESDKTKTLTHSDSYKGFIELISSWNLFLDKMLLDYPSEVAKYGRDSCLYLLNRMDNIKDTELHIKAFEYMKTIIDKMEWDKCPVRFYKLFGTKYELLIK
jgi:glycosyltransferase involved in cell wall biosynthesis